MLQSLLAPRWFERTVTFASASLVLVACANDDPVGPPSMQTAATGGTSTSPQVGDPSTGGGGVNNPDVPSTGDLSGGSGGQTMEVAIPTEPSFEATYGEPYFDDSDFDLPEGTVDCSDWIKPEFSLQRLDCDSWVLEDVDLADQYWVHWAEYDPIEVFESSGQYTAYVTGPPIDMYPLTGLEVSASCEQTVNFDVVVPDPPFPQPSISFSHDVVCKDETVTATLSEADSYYWEGVEADTRSIRVTARETGEYYALTGHLLDGDRIENGPIECWQSTQAIISAAPTGLSIDPPAPAICDYQIVTATARVETPEGASRAPFDVTWYSGGKIIFEGNYPYLGPGTFEVVVETDGCEPLRVEYVVALDDDC